MSDPIYPPDFVTRVKAAYSDDRKIMEDLNRNSWHLGYWLECHIGKVLDMKRFLELVRAGDIDELKRLVEINDQRERIWEEWSTTEVAMHGFELRKQYK